VKPGAPRPVTEDQAAGLLAEPGLDPDREDWEAARDEAVLTLLYGCGLRISEALSLVRADAPIGDLLRITGKGGKTRMVPVLPAVREAVDAYLAQVPFGLEPRDLLFRAKRGGPLSPRHVQATVQTLRSRLGLPASATPHALRHSFATHLLGPGPTCVRSRNCWATRRCRPRSDTPKWTPRRCWGPTTPPIRTPKNRPASRRCAAGWGCSAARASGSTGVRGGRGSRGR
jgi:hypothetical protein